MKKVLIVEDEETNAKILTFHLKSFFKEVDIINYKIDIAENGFEALGMHFNTHYDLILLDVKMPKCDGLKFLSLLRQNRDSLYQPYVSMVTAIGDKDYINFFKQKGANSYLIKPFDKDKIIKILEHAFKIKPSTISSEIKKEIVEEKLENLEITQEVQTIDNNTDTNEEDDDLFEFDFDFDDDFVTDDDTANVNEANKTHLKISAEEFLKDYDNLEYILEDIEDIDVILDNLIHTLDPDTLNDSFHHIEECLRKYSTFLNSLTSFEELATSISMLNLQIERTDFDEFDEKKMFYVIEIIRSILEDLQNWKEFVFVQQSAQDVFYINASILSNIIQLDNILKNK